MSSARSVANGEEAARKLKEEGLTATYLQADVTDSASFSAIRDKLVKDHGGLDVLVNNAGTGFKVIQTSKLIYFLSGSYSQKLNHSSERPTV